MYFVQSLNSAFHISLRNNYIRTVYNLKLLEREYWEQSVSVLSVI